MNMKLLAMLVFASVILVGSNVFAQFVTAKGQASPTKEESIYKIDFAGGTLEEYVALVRQIPSLDKRKMNIVVTNRAKKFQMPSVNVTTNVEGAVGIISGCSTSNQSVLVEPDQSGNVQMIRVQFRAEPTVAVISVNSVIMEMKPKELLAAIEIGLEMMDSEEVVTLKLHEETGLLFVKGPQRATRLVFDVVEELKKPEKGPFPLGGITPGMLGVTQESKDDAKSANKKPAKKSSDSDK